MPTDVSLKIETKAEPIINLIRNIMKIKNIIIEGIDDIINTDENVPEDKSYYKYGGKLPHFRNPQETFENAIEKGIFNKKPKSFFFVGDWMYMHSDKFKQIDFFKNRYTKKFTEVSYTLNLGGK